MEAKNQTEIKKIAIEIFDSNPKAQKVSVASDGTAFITDMSDNAALSYSLKNRYKKELKLTPFLRSEIESADTVELKTAEQFIAAIMSCETQEQVNDLVDMEKAGKNRSSVIAAAQSKLTELLKA